MKPNILKQKFLRAAGGDFYRYDFVATGLSTMLPVRPDFRPVMVGINRNLVIRSVDNPTNGVAFLMFISRPEGGLGIYYGGGPSYYALSHKHPLTVRDKAIIDKALINITVDGVRTYSDEDWGLNIFMN